VPLSTTWGNREGRRGGGGGAGMCAVLNSPAAGPGRVAAGVGISSTCKLTIHHQRRCPVFSGRAMVCLSPMWRVPQPTCSAATHMTCALTHMTRVSTHKTCASPSMSPGSITPQPQPGNDKPRVFRLAEHK
jgi:hypothetical protein